MTEPNRTFTPNQSQEMYDLLKEIAERKKEAYLKLASGKISAAEYDQLKERLLYDVFDDSEFQVIDAIDCNMEYDK